MTKVSTKVIDHGWEALKKASEKFKDCYTTVGVHEDVGNYVENSQLTGVKKKKAMRDAISAFGGGSGISMAQLASVHEYGAEINNGFGKGIHIIIPERSFMRTSVAESAGQREKLARALVGQIIDCKITPLNALSKLGEYATGKMKQRIRKGPFTPLKPSTIKKKGSSKPLINTGQLINSITHKEQMGTGPSEG